MNNVIQVRNIFVPWDYNLISAQIPDDGELVCVKNAPNFTGQNRTVMGDGTHTVAWLISQLVVTPSDLQQEILAEQAARIAGDTTLQGQFNGLSANKQDKKPDGTNNLIGTDGKINPKYIPGSILSGMVYGGTFNASGFISASSYAPALQGVKIDTVNTANYPGFFFIAQNPYIFGGNSYDPGDWAISLGAHTPAWAKIDNASAVSSVNGKTGAVILTKGDVGLDNVDNTRDLDKPVSSAQWTAINAVTQALSSAVAAETEAREEAVSEEAAARINGDTTLQGNINLETAQRQTADNEIKWRIDGIDTEINEIPGIYAPIESPHFTGVPTTPVPSYTVPEQVADVRGIIDLRNILIATLLRDTRVTWGEYTLMPRLRITRNRNRVRGVYYSG
jgi:hypothetical protein